MTDLEKDKILLLAHSIGKMARELQSIKGLLKEIADASQTDAEITELAKEIVHKMIDDAVIAEDAYPDLRQKMHDAVDEYEPQTDCSWR